MYTRNMPLKDATELEWQEDCHYPHSSKIMSDKANPFAQSTISLNVPSAPRICQEWRHLLGNGQADGGREGAVTNMFKGRKFGLVPFDQLHNPIAKERLRKKDYYSRPQATWSHLPLV